MSGWIKWEKDLESDPRVLRMAREIDKQWMMFRCPADDPLDPCNAASLPAVTLVCGALIRLWSFADSHAREDDTLDMSMAELDEWIGIEGFSALMPGCWLRSIDDSTVELPNFQEHNGTQAKKRALTQKRVAQHRNKQQRTSVTDSNAPALPDQTKTRPDQDQEDSTSQGRGKGKGSTKVGRGEGRPPISKNDSPSPTPKNGHDPRSFEVIKGHVLEIATKFKTRDPGQIRKLGGASCKLSTKQVSSALNQLKEDGKL